MDADWQSRCEELQAHIGQSSALANGTVAGTASCRIWKTCVHGPCLERGGGSSAFAFAWRQLLGRCDTPPPRLLANKILRRLPSRLSQCARERPRGMQSGWKLNALPFAMSNPTGLATHPSSPAATSCSSCSACESEGITDQLSLRGYRLQRPVALPALRCKLQDA